MILDKENILYKIICNDLFPLVLQLPLSRE